MRYEKNLESLGSELRLFPKLKTRPLIEKKNRH